MTDADNSVTSDRPLKPWPAMRIGTVSTQAVCALPLEEPLGIEVNGHGVATLMRLPGHESELATGFCVSEGLVSGFRAIELVQHCGQGQPEPPARVSEGEVSRNLVRVRVRPDALAMGALYEIARLIRSGCGAVGRAELKGAGLSVVTSDLSISARLLLRAKRLLRAAQRVHGQTGGVHAAAVFDSEGDLIVTREDIGRHNSVDKVIGHCLMRGVCLGDKLLVSTGRASYEMVTKAIRLGIPILATASACTSLAAELAERYGVTLIGYLRGKRMTVYTRPERVVGRGPSVGDSTVRFESTGSRVAFVR